MNINYDKKIIAIALLACCLLAAVVALRPVYKSGVPEAVFLSEKVAPTKRYQIVVAGDSRVMRGFVPEEFNAQSKTQSLNFGFRSAALDESFLDSARALVSDPNDGASANCAVMLGVSPNAFTANSARDNGYDSALKNTKKSWGRMPGWFYDFQRQLSPVSLTELKNILKRQTSKGLFEVHHADGWIESSQVPANIKQALPFYRVRFTNNQVTDEIMNESLEFVKSTTESGVSVFGFWPPVSAEMKAIEDEKSGFDYESYIAKFKSNGGIWLEPDLTGVETYDGSHLGPEAARLFSQRLGELVDQHFANEGAN